MFGLTSVWRLRNQELGVQGIGEGVGLELKPHDSQSSAPLSGPVIFLPQTGRCGSCKPRSLARLAGFFCTGTCIFRKPQRAQPNSKVDVYRAEPEDKVQEAVLGSQGQHCSFLILQQLSHGLLSLHVTIKCGHRHFPEGSWQAECSYPNFTGELPVG